MRGELNWKIKESEKILEKAGKIWGDDFYLAYTGRKDSSVMLDIAIRVLSKKPKTFFIDHGFHYKESISHIKKTEKTVNMELIWLKDISRINKLKKIKDNNVRSIEIKKYKIRILENFVSERNVKAIATSIRWDEMQERMSEKYFSNRPTHMRVHPLLHFSEEDIWEYIDKYKLSYNPMYDKGFRSFEENYVKKGNISGKERQSRDNISESMMKQLRSMGYF